MAPPLSVEPGEHNAWLDGAPLAIQAKALRLLVTLMQRPQSLWTKDELIEEVWDGRFVSEAVLTTTVKELRRALGDEARNPTFIETVHGKGYRFLLPVDRIAQEPAPRPSPRSDHENSGDHAQRDEPRSRTTTLALMSGALALVAIVAIGAVFWWPPSSEPSAVAQESDSLIVLPFETEATQTGARDQAVMMEEAINAALSRNQEIDTIGRSVAISLTEGAGSAIDQARERGIGYVLEGMLRYSDTRARLRLKLSKTTRGTQLWSRVYTQMPDEELSSFRARVVTEVEFSLATVTDAQAYAQMQELGTQSVRAYRLYLQGVEQLADSTRSGDLSADKRGYNFFEQARTIDPTFAAAHASAAVFWSESIGVTNILGVAGPEDRRRAFVAYKERQELAIANERDPLTKAIYQADLADKTREWRERLRLLEGYLSARPDDLAAYNGYVETAIWLGEIDLARQKLASARALVAEREAPISRIIMLSVFAGDADQAARLGRQLSAAHPDEAFVAYQTHRALLTAEKTAEARDYLRRISAGGLPTEQKLLARLRQACAEDDKQSAIALLAELDLVSDPAARWQAHMIAGEDETAYSILASSDMKEAPLDYAPLVLHAYFDASLFPELGALLDREGAKPRSPDRPAYFCPRRI